MSGAARPQIGVDVDFAARLLRGGKLAAFATETVYGLGALASDKKAVAAMYALKGRPSAHPSIIHLADFGEAEKWARIPPAAKKLAAAFMPGALTLLLPGLSGGAVALRVPAHPQARLLLQKTGGGIAAPSANRFGKISPTTAAHVRAEFPRADLYILDGGECALGIESTIAGCLDGRLFLLRPGAVAAEDIAAAAEMPLSPPPAIAAPGRLPSHYAPRKPLALFSAEALHAMPPVLRLKLPPPRGETEIAAAEAAVLSRRRPAKTAPELWRNAAACPREYARRLYGLLRELDETPAPAILAETPPETPEWAAIRDRLTRASGGG